MANNEYFDIQQLNKSYDDAIFAKAKEIRKSAAERFASKYEIADSDRNAIKSSMLNSVLERNPFDNAEKVLVFNAFLTEKTCAELLENYGDNPIEMIGLYANVVELGAREFIDPDDTSVVHKHLGAAKNNGFFFTPPSVAIRMVLASMNENPGARSVFDPAAGVGVFLAYSILLNERIECVQGIEIDALTAILARNLLSKGKEIKGTDIAIDVRCTDFFEYFDSEREETFDSIIMNPPYGNIKFLASDLTDISTRADLSQEERIELGNKIRQDTMNRSTRLRERFSSYGMAKGTLEYSKLFMAAALDLLSDTGTVVAITPSSWLGDETSTAFRKTIILKGLLHGIWIIPEIAKLFKGVNQPTAVSILGKEPVSVISVSNPVYRIEEVDSIKTSLSLQSVIAVSGEKLKFPKCDGKSMRILVKLQTLGKFKDIDELVNARGELDLTQYKQFVSKSDTGHRLIRGDHIRGWELGSVNDSGKDGYVRYEGFIEAIANSSKAEYINCSRIAIPQCSYLQKKKRIEAAIVPKNSILANSCDFVAINSTDQKDEKEFYYWIFLNSYTVEWEFRIFSYNNHVANSELSELTCLPYASLQTTNCSKLKLLMQRNGEDRYSYFDAFIAVIAGLSKDDYSVILQNVEASEMEKCLEAYDEIQDEKQIEFANHQMPSLSKLDKQIISYVEPGGNWTSIPESVPSKRLDQIRAMAKTRGMVRTTYYSRLKYTQPSYTISTYFNRPGNGANIHPWEDRTLSSREAARLQSFPDSFKFLGNEAAVRTQIGNAVPPLLGYAIGKSIEKAVGRTVKFCDVFAGAGGLSYGMELAGFNGVAAIELNKDAAKTYSANHENNITMVVCDINNESVQSEFISAIEKGISPDEPWVMVGGPPCQGFSTAGYRDENDIRNKLVDSYLKLIQRVQPTIVVMENVQGILSMKGGKVIEGVYASLSKLGYKLNAEPWVLDAEMYGVPQMRRRVIIVASKDEKYLPSVPEALFEKCLGRRETNDGQTSLSFHRYPVTVGEAFWGLPALMPVNTYFPKDAVIDPTYSKWCSGEISTEEFLEIRWDYEKISVNTIFYDKK